MPKGDANGPQHAAAISRGKRLTEELRKLAAEVHDVLPDGTQVTREEALSKLVWQQALGWTEEFRDDNGDLKQVKHPPVAWCQQFLWERIEGKAAQSQPEPEGGLKAVDKVRELTKQRLNAIAAGKSLPPQHRPKE